MSAAATLSQRRPSPRDGGGAPSDSDNEAGSDPSLIGSHCEFPYCNQLDFLPFRCQSCGHTFCLDHRSETAHTCDRAGAWAERKRLADLARPAAGAGKRMRDPVTSDRCAAPKCATAIGTSLVPGVHCDGCGRDYCLQHRLAESHSCATLEPVGGPAGVAAAAAAATNNMLAKLRLWGKERKEAAATRAQETPGTRLKSIFKSKAPSTAAARVLALNELKRAAKGDAKIPPEKRVYLHVSAGAESTANKVPQCQSFYSRDWVVGKMLDTAARDLQVENVNNQSAEEKDKLRVYHVEGGRVLEFNEKIGVALTSGNTIVLMRGIGALPDLIEA
jgi:predicted nucleic acid binding AN1-type Zn finger protein